MYYADKLRGWSDKQYSNQSSRTQNVGEVEE